jgi:nucleoid DNA-binding protein
MAELKTKKNKASVAKFLSQVENEQKRKDSNQLLNIFTEVTKQKPVMWGTSIVGFGSYHYKYKSGQEGDWPLTGFSPRKQNISIYIMPGFKEYKDLMKKLGTYKTAVSCLYIKRLSDIHIPTLKQLIQRSVADMKKRYPTST